ncbi:tyrosyl-DNA phosphodiesterase-domain-containing protein [Dichotomocladium elegans]|nr:tyrosyl-DNA phosphodiesterase-domain-containing protein [Dichotomocladium elegans]
MSNSDDDHDLKRAIALSLSEQNMEDVEFQRAITLSLESHAQAAASLLRGTETGANDEDEDIRRAIALSLNKPVEKLTAREALGLTPAAEAAKNKRMLERASGSTATHNNKRMRTEKEGSFFWEGVVKLTHIDGYSGPNFIRIEDIILKDHLQKAVMTAFMVSLDFIQEHIPKDVNLCIVMHGRPAMARQLSPTRTYVIPPLKDSKYGVFHPKLMILVHKASLRVVIGSANLERYDYHDLENVVFIQDFKLLETPVSDLPEFGKDLCDLLDAMGVPQSVKAELRKYDFSTAKARLVASISGEFEGEDDYKRYGHARLAHIVQDMVGDELEPTRVEMQTSSLGGLTSTYLHELYRSFSGNDPYADGKRPARLPKPDTLPPIDVVFPSLNTVRDSKLGPTGAGTICLNRTSWQKPSFPKQVMCDAISIRPGTLMHSKGWVYCGSHNATVSAWGKLNLSKTTRNPKMSMSNWELGVVLPIYEDSQIPVTYRRPPPRYKPDQEPWMQDMLFSS